MVWGATSLRSCHLRSWSGAAVGGPASIVAGVAIGLVFGKPIGIVVATRIVVKLGITKLPPQVTWRGIVIVGAVAGIGFTMALFITNLAFKGNPWLQQVSTVDDVRGHVDRAWALTAGT
jgi:Na+/H+ antiporter NhaA